MPSCQLIHVQNVQKLFALTCLNKDTLGACTFAVAINCFQSMFKWDKIKKILLSIFGIEYSNGCNTVTVQNQTKITQAS